MTLESVWSLSAITCSLSAVAALCLGWVIWRRVSRVRETFLLISSLVMLAAHYGFAAADGFVHAGGRAAGRFTDWSVMSQACALLFWAAMTMFLLAVIVRLNAPYRLDQPSVWVTILLSTSYSLFAAFLIVRCVIDAPSAMQADMARLMGGLFQQPHMHWIWPVAIVSLLRDRVPKGERTGLAMWLAGGRPEVISLDLSDYPQIPLDSPVSGFDFKLLASVGIPGLLIGIVLATNGSPHWTLWRLILSTFARFLLLPSLMGLVFFKTRYSFFDVVAKRGVLFVVSAAVMIPACGLALAWSLPSVSPSGRAALCAVATLLVWLATEVFERGDRVLDRILFHRPDYREELQSISVEMSRCADSEALSKTVTSGVARAVHANYVRFEPVAQPCQLAVPVGSRGYLAFGPRERGQRYGSEDLNFIDTVAAQFGGMLESFEARRSAQLAAAAELKALKAQINPHFLFNTLNTLAEMVKQQPETERTVLNLSRIFRHALDSTQHETVPLREELAAVRAYLEIEKERFEDRLHFEFDVPEEVLDTPVAPMLIQPLVENAVKHGLAGKVDGGTVRIAAERGNGRLRVTVGDDGVGFDPALIEAGVGMANVRARVEKSGGSWRVESRAGEGTKVVFEAGIA